MAAPTRILVGRPVGWTSKGMVCVVSPDSALHGEYVDAQSYDELLDAIETSPAPTGNGSAGERDDARSGTGGDPASAGERGVS